MLRDEPQNYYHRKALARTLYGLAKYRNARKFFDLHTDFEDVPGQSQQVYYLLENLGRREMNALALSHVFRLQKEFPADEDLEAMADDLFSELMSEHGDYVENLARNRRTSPRPVAKVPKETPPEKEEGEETGGQIKTRSVWNNIHEGKLPSDPWVSREGWFEEADMDKEEEEYIRYAFVDLFKDRQFEKAMEKARLPNNPPEGVTAESLWRKGRDERKTRLKGRKLGLDKVVFVKPFYSKLDQRKTVPVKYMDSETAEGDLNKMLLENADRVGLEIELLDPLEMDPEDVDQFNDMIVLNDWLVDRLGHEDVEMVAVNQDAVKKMQQKYGTRNFAWTGIFAVTDNKSFMKRTLACFYGCATGVLLPFAIYYYLEPEHNTYQFTLLFDVETGEVNMADLHQVKFKDSQTYRNSMIYNTMLQMAAK